MLYAAVLLVILAALLAVAVYKVRTIKKRADFLVAGRSLGWPVLVFTLLSSWIGAGSLFAGGENAYKIGFAALWQPAGGWLGLLVIALIAGRARRFSQFTVPDLLETRYNAAARVFASIAIVASCTMITSYQFKAGGDVLHLIFPELSRTRGMYIIAAFVITLTALAGMASVAYVDLVIGLLVTTTALIAMPVAIGGAGGWAGVRQALPADHFTVFGSITPATAWGYLLPTFLLLVGNQGMYQKFFSAKSERDARLAVFGWIAGTLVLETVIIALAVVGSARFRLENAREIIPTTARLGLPQTLGAILLGGVFAKVISTGNNYLFSPSSNLIHDIYARFLRPGAGEREVLFISRVTVVLLGAFALAQAAYLESILRASLYAYTVYGAAVTPAVMAVFFWKRATTEGAISSILLGTILTIVWNLVPGWKEWVEPVYPALIASLASLVVVSLLTSAPAEEKLRAFV
ncbi:MAG: sodium:solute symporter family protein [Acidobacteria bacterium]|nr:sodium:solute symporter family protein [Acidobacteriota bacterium]